MIERPRYEFAEPSRSLYGKYGDGGYIDNLYWADYGDGVNALAMVESKVPAPQWSLGLSRLAGWFRALPSAIRALTPVPGRA